MYALPIPLRNTLQNKMRFFWNSYLPFPVQSCIFPGHSFFFLFFFSPVRRSCTDLHFEWELFQHKKQTTNYSLVVYLKGGEWSLNTNRCWILRKFFISWKSCESSDCFRILCGLYVRQIGGIEFLDRLILLKYLVPTLLFLLILH